MAGAAFAAGNSTLVDGVGSTGFVQLEAQSLKTLNLKEQTMAYWLTQASIAIDPTYRAGINSELTATLDAAGKITTVP